MEKEKAFAWADALTSGKFKQGYGMLRGNRDGCETKHCCLGVLCEINNIPLIEEGNFYYLSDDAVKQSGIARSKGRRTDDQKISINGIDFNDLAHANDSKVAFEDIAEYIKNNYEAL